MSHVTSKPAESALDPIVEDETQKGFRVKAVPAELMASVQEYGVGPFSHVRMTGLNPTRRRKITEVVQRAYFKDLQDEGLLSNARVLELVTKNGEWSPAIEARLKELQERTTTNMATLYQEGMSQSRAWLEQLTLMLQSVLDAIAGSELEQAAQDEYVRRLTRWHQYRPEKQPLYAERYATELTAGIYYPATDFNWLLDNALTMEMADTLEDLSTLSEKVQNYLTLVQEREEYESLRIKRLRMFANTIESRRDNAEEMARAYFTTERCDDAGMPTGPLALTFEALYDFPDEMITWLVEEQFFFHNRIPDEVRQYLGSFGFQTAATETTEDAAPQAEAALSSTSDGSSEASAALPEGPKLSIDSPLSTETPSSSSV